MAHGHERERRRLRVEDILEYLGGLGFPCRKDEVLRAAIGQGAPDEVVAALERLPDEVLSSFDDITRNFGRSILL